MRYTGTPSASTMSYAGVRFTLRTHCTAGMVSQPTTSGPMARRCSATHSAACATAALSARRFPPELANVA
uniref:Uncharacterized protein n=1 Tax=Leishmania guyanensis TaxID=5670 RepID=A0A1E1J9F6_LEIGU|nr:Hypothetical protein BN36_NA77610 [Leishmania guyanensis]